MIANREASGEFGSKEVIARYSMKHIHDSKEENQRKCRLGKGSGEGL
jgi:hypothetical protein